MDHNGHIIAIPTKSEQRRPNGVELAYNRMKKKYPDQVVHRLGEQCRNVRSATGGTPTSKLSGLMQSALALTGTRDVNLGKVIPAIRDHATLYNVAKNLKEERIDDISMLPDDVSRYLDNTRLVHELCEQVLPWYRKIDLTQKGNSLTCRYLTVTNIENRQLHQGTSMGFTQELSLDVWYPRVYKKKVSITYDADESVRLNVETNQINYHTYTVGQDLARALKLAKRDVEMLTAGERRTIENKMQLLNTVQDRTMRLLKAALTYLYLLYGGDGDFLVDSKGGDEVGEYNARNLTRWAQMEDTAYIHCNDADNADYMAFLYIITREYPFKRMSNGSDMFAGSVWNMPSEGERTVVVCDTMPGGSINGIKNYTANMWLSFINQYAQDMGLTDKLDDVFTRAHILLYSGNIPACTVSRPISNADLFRPCILDSVSAGKTIKVNVSDRMVIGSFIISYQIGLMLKELVSHETTADLDRPVKQSILYGLRDKYGYRGKVYTHFERDYFTRAFNVVRGIDPLRVETDDDYHILDSEPIMSYYWTRVRSGRSLARTFAQLCANGEWASRNVYKNTHAINRRNIAGLLNFMGVLTQARADKATLVLHENNWNNRDYERTEECLDAGPGRIINDGMIAGHKVKRQRKERRFKKLEAPIEHREEDEWGDDLVPPAKQEELNYDDLKDSSSSVDGSEADNEESTHEAEREGTEHEGVETEADVEDEEEGVDIKEIIAAEKERARIKNKEADEKAMRDTENAIKGGGIMRASLIAKKAKCRELSEKIKGWIESTQPQSKKTGSLRRKAADDWSTEIARVMGLIKGYHSDNKHKEVKRKSMLEFFEWNLNCDICNSVLEDVVKTNAHKQSSPPYEYGGGMPWWLYKNVIKHGDFFVAGEIDTKRWRAAYRLGTGYKMSRQEETRCMKVTRGAKLSNKKVDRVLTTILRTLREWGGEILIDHMHNGIQRPGILDDDIEGVMNYIKYGTDQTPTRYTNGVYTIVNYCIDDDELKKALVST